MFDTSVNNSSSNYVPPRTTPLQGAINSNAAAAPSATSVDDLFDFNSTPSTSSGGSTAFNNMSANSLGGDLQPFGGGAVGASTAGTTDAALDDFFKQEALSASTSTAATASGGYVQPSGVVGPGGGGSTNMQAFGSAPPPSAFQNALPEFLKNAKHPVICAFHLLFKTLCLFVYLFGSYLWSNMVLTYIFCILFLAFDFWTVKNVTGRLLVGLRWWNVIRDGDDGEEVNEWIFESLQDETQLDPLDKNVFWLGTYTWALIWTLFLILNVISLSFSWLVFLVVANVFAWSNLVAFWKCSRDQKDKMQNWVTGAMFQKATGLDLGNLV